MKLAAIISVLESMAPLAYQESYDNSGLAVGESDMEISGVLLCIDITMPVLEEAIEKGLNLVISHHPVIFSALKQLTGKTVIEKIVLKAIRHNIAIYCAHTNLDNINSGVNRRICDKLGLINTHILMPMQQNLKKLVTFVPRSHADQVRLALFSAGAGHIGKYDSCSFNTEGQGSFRALEGASPFVGEIQKLHFEDEIRIETIFQATDKARILDALLKAHPYEEVAYDLYPVENIYEKAGSGMMGDLKEAMQGIDFLKLVKEIFKCSVLRHTKLPDKQISKVAVCGGSGAFLIPKAISAGADLFLTGEVKYHQFFDAEDKIVIADIGHYESEQYTIEIFYDILIKNLPNFAIHFSSINTSPIYYF